MDPSIVLKCILLFTLYEKLCGKPSGHRHHQIVF